MEKVAFGLQNSNISEMRHDKNKLASIYIEDQQEVPYEHYRLVLKSTTLDDFKGHHALSFKTYTKVLLLIYIVFTFNLFYTLNDCS